MEFQARCLVLFHLFSVISGFDWFLIGSLCKNSQLMLLFQKAPSLVLYFSHYFHDLPGDGICNVVVYADVTIFYSKCNQVSNLWQQRT